MSLKPILAGCVKVYGSTLPTGYTAASMSNFTIKATWAGLQTADANALAGPDVAIVDNALAAAASQGRYVRIRLECGRFTPAWEMTKAGTFLHANSYDQTAPARHPRYWQSVYITDYARLIQLMADRWDTNAHLREVTISGGMLWYAEPLIKSISDKRNRAELVGGGVGWSGHNINTPGAGYSVVIDIAAQKAMIDAHDALTTTRSSFAYNPYQRIDSYSSASVEGSTLPVTKEIIDYQRATLGTRAVLENNSVRQNFFTYDSAGQPTGIAANIGSMKAMYLYFISKGQPLAYQTATSQRIGDFHKTMDAIVNILDGNSVEVPADFNNLWKSSRADANEYSPAWMHYWDQALQGNTITPPDSSGDGGGGGGGVVGGGTSGGGTGGSGDGGDTGNIFFHGLDDPGTTVPVTYPGTNSPYVWVMRLYDRQGNFLCQLDEAYNRKLEFNLNDIDSCSFSVPLDWEFADLIQPLKTSVKVWRRVFDPQNAVDYFDDDMFPCYAGVVGPLTEVAENNEMQVQSFSAFWKLEQRYHIDRHVFTDVDPSLIMWSLIAFTNNVNRHTNGDRTGILGPTVYNPLWEIYGSWASYDPPVLYTVHTPRGQNSWQIIQDIISQAGFPDLVPLYTHREGSRALQFFNTAIVRGVRPDDSVCKFEYRTGMNNLDGLTRSISVEPGKFGTHVTAQGAGDTDAFKVTYPKVFDTTQYDKIDEYGLYMKWVKYDSVQRREHLRAYARALTLRSNSPISVLQPTLNPMVPPYYKVHFDVGDVVKLSCIRGSMSFTDLEQRIYQISLEMDENNVEKVSLQMAPDFTASVPP